jgi:hypothetical protein
MTLVSFCKPDGRGDSQTDTEGSPEESAEEVFEESPDTREQ